MVIKLDDKNRLFGLGQKYYKENNLEKAIKYFKRLTVLDPSYFEAHFYLSAVYELNGDVQSAIGEFEILVKLKPKDRQLKDFLLKLYFKTRNYRKAISLIKTLIVIDPFDIEYKMLLSEALFFSGRYMVAEKILKKEYKTNKYNQKLIFNLMLTLREQRKHREAKRYCLKLVKLFPSNPIYHYFLGTIYEDMRRFDKMKQELDKVHSLLTSETKENRDLYKEIAKRISEHGMGGVVTRFI
jgi:tetratricopeptide (TPR) repeat protein